MNYHINKVYEYRYFETTLQPDAQEAVLIMVVLIIMLEGVKKYATFQVFLNDFQVFLRLILQSCIFWDIYSYLIF